jgi:hypothetical protein
VEVNLEQDKYWLLQVSKKIPQHNKDVTVSNMNAYVTGMAQNTPKPNTKCTM